MRANYKILGAILDEVSLHQIAKRIPSSIKLKDYGSYEFSQSRDPTLLAPKNTIQAEDTDYLISKSNSNSQEIIKLNRNSDSNEKMGISEAPKGFYQALKRGLRRLSSIRRNNSA